MEIARQSRSDAWDRVLRAGALGWPWGMGWGRRREGSSGWGTHVQPWLIHVSVWQKTTQYCKVISIQLKKKRFYHQTLARVLWALFSTRLQFSSVAQSCPTLWDPMFRSTPGLPVHHQLPEFTQTHVHRVSDAIQSSHPLSSPSPLAPNPSQHQSLFQWVNSSHEYMAKVLEFQL